MSTPARLALFALTLVVLFLGGYGIGRVVGPVGDTPAPAHGHEG